MKRLCLALAFVAACTLLATRPAGAQSCSIGGHNETSENFNAAGGWTIANMSPGVATGPPSAPHLVFSELAVRGAGTGAASDSSEYIEIYNPTTRPVSLNDKYVSDDVSYYKVVNGPFAVANTSDFCLRFPSGLTLDPGRTLILCVTKAGFAGSGATPGPAQYFLEMRDSNGNPADDMLNVATGSTFPLTGGMLTNASTTNGEWIVLFCWNGSADCVCDIDYASWGANSASNPKMDKSGIAIDGPDAGAATSAYNADTPAASQTNLGTAALTKPNTYQRFAGEASEIALGGNGCLGQVVVTAVNWVPVPNPVGGTNIRFHVRFQNPDDDAPSSAVSGQMHAQDFGVFQQDLGLIGDINVPPLQPSSFFDVFLELPLAQLPPAPQKIYPGGGGAGAAMTTASVRGPVTAFDCPPDTNWAGNVDIQWVGPGQAGQVNKHYADLRTCAGGAPSYIHFRPSNCPAPMPWTISGLCPGFGMTLVNEDLTPAPNPVPVGWSGFIQVTAGPVPSGTSCCPSITFTCGTQSSTIDICTTACDCGVNPPKLSSVDWVPVPNPLGGTNIRFHQHWTNVSASQPTDPASGNMSSQEFGVFQPDFGPIGGFNVPPIAPNSFFDVFFDVPLANLPPPPPKIVPNSATTAELAAAKKFPTTNSDCPPDTNWAGNVDIQWTAAGQPGSVNKHYADLLGCIGGAPSYIHFRPSNCTAPMPWSVSGLCPGWSVTLVNEDFTPAPNPVPVGWSGWIEVTVAGAVPSGSSCCFSLNFGCKGASATIDICSTACICGNHPPTLSNIDWTTSGGVVTFHQHWTNPDPSVATEPVSGHMNSQEFGVFLPNFGPIGNFNIPPIAPSSFFDVFFDVPLSALPANPVVTVPGGNPAPGTPCYMEDHWHGNVNVDWSGGGTSASVGKHFGEMPLCAGGPATTLFVETACGSALGASWSISGLCPGYTATLLNTDSTPAPNPVPLNWVGLIAVTAPPGTPVGTICCFSVNFACDGVVATIDVCTKVCECAHPQPTLSGLDWTLNGSNVKFHMRWDNPSSAGDSDPVSGTMNSQPFGAFAPDFGPIGQFNIPPMAPNSFFDVFLEVPLSSLPPEPTKILPGGGPNAVTPKGATTESQCPPDTSWSGNVDINWAGPGGGGQVNRHFTRLLVNPGNGTSHVHTLIFCNSPIGASWSIAGLCPGWSATLLNEDFTPAPNPVPPGWTGWISVGAAAGTLPGSSCCFTVTFVCDGHAGVIDVCAEACDWAISTGVVPNPQGLQFGILRTAPNPTSGDMAISFVVPKSDHINVGIYDLAGRRVRMLFSGSYEAGVQSIRWDGNGEGGRKLAPGAYFVMLQNGDQQTTRKLLISR